MHPRRKVVHGNRCAREKNHRIEDQVRKHEAGAGGGRHIIKNKTEREETERAQQEREEHADHVSEKSNVKNEGAGGDQQGDGDQGHRQQREDLRRQDGLQTILTAQVFTLLAMTLVSIALLIATGSFVFHVRFFGNVISVFLALLLGSFSFFALGFVFNDMATT